MQVINETNVNVKVCGKPYAVCIAETPEEAEKLYAFMRGETTPTCPCDIPCNHDNAEYDCYVIEYGEYYPELIIDEKFNTLEDAKTAMEDYLEENDSGFVYGLTRLMKSERVSEVKFIDC